MIFHSQSCLIPPKVAHTVEPSLRQESDKPSIEDRFLPSLQKLGRHQTKIPHHKHLIRQEFAYDLLVRPHVNLDLHRIWLPLPQ